MIARRSISMVLVWLCGVAGGLLLWSAPALAQRMHAFSSSFGSEGSGEGQLSRPGQLAVNEATGDVYVVDRGNQRVEIFSSTGAYVGQFNGSAAPTGAFSFFAKTPTNGPLPEGSVAVDNSANPFDPSKGDVYVADTAHRVVDKFTAGGAYIGQVTGASPASPFSELYRVAVDPNGALWVQVATKGGVGIGRAAEGNIYQFNDATENEYVSQIFTSFPFVSAHLSGELGNIGFAFDSEDNLYVGKSQEFEGGGFNVPAEFTDEGQILEQELDGEETTGVGVDLASNDAYVDHATSVAAYDSSGSLVERFGSGEMNASEGIAVDSKTGAVYTADTVKQEIDVFTAFVVPDVTTGSVSSFGETSVSVGGVVDPDGLPVTSCEFEYGTSASYGQSEPCSTSPGSGGSPVAVGAELKGLERLTEYHFRLKVSNANGSNVGQDRTLFTPEPVGISETGVSDVSSSSALFSALVDPEDADTTFHFEYGTSPSYGESLPAPDGDLGGGASSERTAIRAQGLAPDTTYHVRIVASNALGTMYGPDETFTTQVGGGAFVLPDDRAWELVSPPSKEGASVEPMSEGAIEASEDGSAITYFVSGPIESDPAGNPSPLGPSQVISRRGAAGWSSEDLATPHIAAEIGNVEYRSFSPDLSQALVEPDGDAPLSPETTERTPYVRALTSGSYVPLVSASNVPPGTKFGNRLAGEGGVNALVGTPDLSHVILRSEDLLTSNAIGNSSGSDPSLYEWSGGRLQLVNILPDGTATEAAYLAGRREYRHAVSNDGSRVFWEGNGGNLYMRDTVTGKTLQVNAPAPGVSPPERGNAVFQLASADGTKVVFRENYPLTLDSTLPSTGGAADLYVCQIVEEAGEPKCDLTDLSVDRNAGERADVQENIVGASEDGSIVYFVADGKLAEGAQVGAENLYVESESGSTWSAPRLVAVLSEAPTARVSPDGRYLAFMSDTSLTGYDNRDANSGQPDQEVFLYDEATGRLVCASCNPTGARPDGIFDPGGLLIDRRLGGKWLAASIPGWTLISETGNNEEAGYQSRYLSDEGRLFFDSADALVPQDTNGREDVYEYEPTGVGGPGGCTTSETTYVGSADGCMSLISSGTSAEESAFMDASATGNDVFFVTAARLTSNDVDTSLDMYDARVCSTGAPCVSAPVSPPPCASGDACKAAPAPQPAIFGAPSSATFSGAGNVTASTTTQGASTPKHGGKKEPTSRKPKPKPKRKRRGKGNGKSSRVRKGLSISVRR